MSSYLTILFVFFFCHEIAPHGMMLDPPNRSSLWRFDSSATPNYDDNQNFCGGYSVSNGNSEKIIELNHKVQWATFNGNCGVCGDKYDDPHPQDNENTGKYGQGKVVKSYRVGSTIDVEILLTTNHRGYFKFSLCVLEDFNAPESGEGCFQSINLANGDDRYWILSTEKNFTVQTQLQLPQDLMCDRCVLRWHYNAGNTWGTCENGTSATGCGPQETFRSCADVSITL